MIINKSIVPGILIKIRKGLGTHINYNNYGDRDNSKDRFYILTEIKTDDGHCDEDLLVFYGLFEERFFPVYRWHFDESIGNGAANIVV